MYDPTQPYQQDFLNGFSAMPLSNRNPLAAAKKVAPPVIPKASGRIGSLPSPKKKPMQAMLPPPSPVPQGAPGSYNPPPSLPITRFQPKQEAEFQAWAAAGNHPLSDDYDMRGYYNAIGKHAGPRQGDAHYPDTFKLPNHATYSNESKFAQYVPTNRHWEGDRLMDGARMIADERTEQGVPPELMASNLPQRAQTEYDRLPSFSNPEGAPKVLDLQGFMDMSNPNSPSYLQDQYEEWQHTDGPKGTFEQHLQQSPGMTNWYEHGDGTVTPVRGGRVVGPRQTHEQAGLPMPPGQALQQRGQMPGRPPNVDPRQGQDGLIHQGGYAFEPGSKVDQMLNGQGLLPGRPQIQQSYGMPSQRPGYLPQGMQQAPMPVYQRGGVIGPEVQGLMNQVLQKQLMDQLNYQPTRTGGGAMDGLMGLVSGLVPGSAKYLDGQLANRQAGRLRDAQIAQQDNDNRRAWTQQMLQSITSNDPLSLASQNQLFNQQNAWQNTQIAGVNAGTGAFTAEDNAQKWRAQLPSQQWVDQQGAVNQAGQVRNQGETNRINDSYHAQQERQAIADREQAWKIAQMQNQIAQNEIRFKDINSQRQYGVNGGKPKQASPADLAKAIAQLYTKDGTPIIQDPAMHEQLVNQLAMQLGVDPAMLKPAQEAEPQGFDFMKALGGLFSQGQQQKAPPPTGLAALSDAELQKLRAAHAKKKQPKASK